MNDLTLTLLGIMVILALSLLTPYFYFIPKATLSSVIICAVLFMVEIGMVKPMWKSNSEYRLTRPTDIHCVHRMEECLIYA
jgi:MFS superfamily sulfate permease-like transporter